MSSRRIRPPRRRRPLVPFGALALAVVLAVAAMVLLVASLSGGSSAPASPATGTPSPTVAASPAPSAGTAKASASAGPSHTPVKPVVTAATAPLLTVAAEDVFLDTWCPAGANFCADFPKVTNFEQTPYERSTTTGKDAHGRTVVTMYTSSLSFMYIQSDPSQAPAKRYCIRYFDDACGQAGTTDTYAVMVGQPNFWRLTDNGCEGRPDYSEIHLDELTVANCLTPSGWRTQHRLNSGGRGVIIQVTSADDQPVLADRFSASVNIRARG